jgi:hypothetical protein
LERDVSPASQMLQGIASRIKSRAQSNCCWNLVICIAFATWGRHFKGTYALAALGIEFTVEAGMTPQLR